MPMKRKLSFLGLVLTLLLGIYSAAAWIVLRGTGAYRVGTTLGTVLAVSRPYTTLAAVFLFAVTGAVLIVYLRRRNANKGTAAPEKIAPKRGTPCKQPEPKLQPARGTAGEATVPNGPGDGRYGDSCFIR